MPSIRWTSCATCAFDARRAWHGDLDADALALVEMHGENLERLARRLAAWPKVLVPEPARSA